MKDKVFKYSSDLIDNECNKENLALSCLRWCIAFFFIASPFNPSINDLTLYIWFPLMFCDRYFIGQLIKRINLNYLILFILWIGYCLFSLKIGLAIKFIAIFIGVTYLFFLNNFIIKKIYVCFLFSAIFCIIQFFSFLYSPELAYQLGPGNIAVLLWGKFATLTYTNQYVVFLFPRMSGLSREAGFFVSLLCIVFLIRIRYGKLTFIEKVIFLLGFLFSLSKVSILGVILPILFLFRSLIKKIPTLLTLLIVFSVYCVVAIYLNIGSTSFFYDNESIAHRLSSAYLIFNMRDNYILTGCPSDYQCFTSDGMALVDYLVNGRHLLPSIGLPGLIIEFGILGIVLILSSMIILKFDSFKLLLLVLFTSTVYILTMDNFTILLYYYLISSDLRQIK
ncbi:hypothetical protein DES39_1905 [Orbus hercynius]|uniref:O-antigen ligase-like membrane protein n=1 Tax=Orbus hercynius TaxID=593135 RepID=A0A495RBH5_9GAMM|nr:hypothetical protein [Orbus hercynius]RKS84691.1 hypothetical protein DES39_1905 [Orbus hercynius]